MRQVKIDKTIVRDAKSKIAIGCPLGAYTSCHTDCAWFSISQPYKNEVRSLASCREDYIGEVEKEANDNQISRTADREKRMGIW